MSSQTSAAPGAAASGTPNIPANSPGANSRDQMKKMLAMQLINQGLGGAAAGAGQRTAQLPMASYHQNRGPQLQAGGQMINGGR